MSTNATKPYANSDGLKAFVALIVGLPQSPNEVNIEMQLARQRYVCGDCGRQFDDLTGSVFAGRRQPLSVWIAYLYLMGLNLANQQEVSYCSK